MTDASMMDLFRMEVEQQGSTLNDALLSLEQTPDDGSLLEMAMRASHSLKGAARLVNIPPVVDLAHRMEDCFVAAQENQLILSSDAIDVCLAGLDLIRGVAAWEGDLSEWQEKYINQKNDVCARLDKTLEKKSQEKDLSVSSATKEAGDEGCESGDKPIADMSMLELFYAELDQQGRVLSDGLLALEESCDDLSLVEPLMRAAHSIKGAARLVGLQSVVSLAHVIEDVFVAAQNQVVVLEPGAIDVLLQGVDLLLLAGKKGGEGDPLDKGDEKYSGLMERLSSLLADSDGKKTVDKSPVASHESSVSLGNIADMSMRDLFNVEVEQQGSVLSEGLLALEQSPGSAELLESLMRAAHSIKGAARLIGLQAVVELAHVMEDVFVAAQKAQLNLTPDAIDVLLRGLDSIFDISRIQGDVSLWLSEHKGQRDQLLLALKSVLEGEKIQLPAAQVLPAVVAAEAVALTSQGNKEAESKSAASPKLPLQKERVLRVSAERINRLMGLAGEALVESRWLLPYADSLQRLKRQQTDLITLIDALRDKLDEARVHEDVVSLARNAQRQASFCREIMADRLAELESYDRRATNLSSRLHREVVQSRMRPFGDGVHGFPRMVRDISRSLGKEVQFNIVGEMTMVDRDILDKIEAPLNHVIRNAIDHGLEMPEEREAAGKPRKGTIQLEAYHHSGMLSIVVRDDGRGIDLERLRRKVVEKKLVDESMRDSLSEAELLEFLFLPSFSTRDTVSEISGRGVGLDVVHEAVQEMRGSVRAISEFGYGTKFHMQLPLTLSVIPALLTEIAGEPYAFPLARIDKILYVEAHQIGEAEGTQFISVNGKSVGLVGAAHILEFSGEIDIEGRLPVVILHERNHYYGMVVDKFLGERELVVQVMPEALGKVQNISSAALMENGSPVLIVDVDDLIRSIEKVLKVTRIAKVSALESEEYIVRKRILVVDDSITVREVERKLLERIGYQVEVAVDGIDGLNALRRGNFDLLVTDVDMPRMNGIELVKTVRQDPALRSIPIMMVSYKDREEDRMRGLDAGADYYLTKGSFHDESLREAVMDLIGEAVK